MKRGVLVWICLAGLLGCGGMQTSYNPDHGSVMMDSGFRPWNVDSANEKAFFTGSPSGTIMTNRRDNQVVHVYKDPNTGVVYVGDEKALKSYLQKTNSQGMSPKSQEESGWDPNFWTMLEIEQGA